MARRPAPVAATAATVEGVLRDAARAFHDALRAARASGYVVSWPRHPEGLLTLAVSETCKVQSDPTATVFCPVGSTTPMIFRNSPVVSHNFSPEAEVHLRSGEPTLDVTITPDSAPTSD